jgi:hypothetical protein
MAESNSVFGGGQSGISDTLGPALSGVDVMFTSAEARWLGINFHGGGIDYYTPIAGQTSSGAFEPRPLYYAMLLFAYAGRDWLVPINKRGVPRWLRAFAVRGAGGEHRIILINTNLSQNEHVRIATTGQKATFLRLTATSVESKSGLTFGGASSVGQAVTGRHGCRKRHYRNRVALSSTCRRRAPRLCRFAPDKRQIIA